ncbi:MAG: type II toxin-antitoxin system RelE family toxin [Geminicoccaceae bacterium]
MRVRLARRATRDLEALPPALRARVKKQLDLLAVNLRHPSLRAKKFDERRDIWQGRVNREYRFYFTIDGDTYRILSIIPHPK